MDSVECVEDTGNLPTWPGASEAYDKAQKVLRYMALNAGPPRYGVSATKMTSTNSKKSDSWIVCTDDMRTLIAALGKGDEETIKWFNLEYNNHV